MYGDRRIERTAYILSEGEQYFFGKCCRFLTGPRVLPVKFVHIHPLCEWTHEPCSRAPPAPYIAGDGIRCTCFKPPSSHQVRKISHPLRVWSDLILSWFLSWRRGSRREVCQTSTLRSPSSLSTTSIISLIISLFRTPETTVHHRCQPGNPVFLVYLLPSSRYLLCQGRLGLVLLVTRA